MPRLPRNLHLVATWRSPANAIRKKHATRLKCCACHAKWRWTRPKCVRWDIVSHRGFVRMHFLVESVAAGQWEDRQQQQQQQTSWIALWFAQLKVCKCCSTHSAPHIQAYKRLWYFQRCLCPTSTTSWARAAHVMRFFRSWLSGAQRHSNCPRHVSMPASKHGDHQLLLPGADASISSSHDTFCSFLFFKLPVWDGSGGHSERIPGSQIEVSSFYGLSGSTANSV